jgi:hypothetical protein
MTTELIDVCKKPSELNETEHAIISAMQSSLLSMIEETIVEYGNIFPYDPDTGTYGSDVLLIGASQGKCEIGVRNALGYINDNHLDLFTEEFILAGKDVKHFPDHYIGVLKGKDGNYYAFSPANFLTEEVAEIMGTYNHLGYFIKSPDLKSLLAFIQETEEGFWADIETIENSPDIQISQQDENPAIPRFYPNRQ